VDDDAGARALISQRVRLLGQQTSAAIFDELKKAYAPLLIAADAQKLTIERDLSYGPHARHKLNVFAMDPVHGESKDVLVFVHGGAFITGDKEEAPGAFYDNVGVWAAGEGMIGVTISYRLAPANAWPAGSEDVAAAIRWIGREIFRFGGNPRRIFLMGHSAGAAHVAGFLVTAQDARDIAGCICLSGVYDLTIPPVNVAYFGEDASLYPARSPLTGLARATTPLLILITELDPEAIQRQAMSLLDARLKAKHSLPYLAQLRGHNHFSGILHLNSTDRALSNEILKFTGNVSGTG
jgi:triacylglycerol lipase